MNKETLSIQSPESQVPIIVQSVNPDRDMAYFAEKLPDIQPKNMAPIDINISVDQKQPGSFMRKVKGAGAVALVGLSAVGAYSAYNWMFGGEGEYGYKATISAPKTKVYEDVYLNLATTKSTFIIQQDTFLDRANDSIIDYNPFDYDTTLDTNITTESHEGVRVGRLTATKKGKTMNVALEGDIVTTNPSIDWDKDSVDPHMQRGLQIGVDAGELNKARGSAMKLIQRAGEISTACALKQDNVQVMFENGVKEFLKSTSFTDGISVDNLKVTFPGIDTKADVLYGMTIDSLHKTVSEIEKGYDSPDGKFEVNTANLENCEKHKISIVQPKTSR